VISISKFNDRSARLSLGCFRDPGRSPSEYSRGFRHRLICCPDSASSQIHSVHAHAQPRPRRWAPGSFCIREFHKSLPSSARSLRPADRRCSVQMDRHLWRVSDPNQDRPPRDTWLLHRRTGTAARNWFEFWSILGQGESPQVTLHGRRDECRSDRYLLKGGTAPLARGYFVISAINCRS